jgi:membrane-associated phospholipid phosphatase
MFARRWLAARVDPDRRLGIRLGLAVVVVCAVAIPFTLLAVLVKTAFEPITTLDARVAHDLNVYALAHPDWTRFITVWSEVFGPWPWRVAVILFAGWLIYRGAPRLAAWAITTITLGGLLGLGLKLLVDRTRPVFPDPVAVAPGESFPSGHALSATLGAGVIVLLLLPVLRRHPRLRVLAWSIAAFLALSVAYTRIALGVHWVSDAIGGVLLGIGVIAGTTIGFESWRRELGRAPALPHREGVEPEAEEEISPRGAVHGSRH